MVKYLFITLGTISLGIGITGIFIPGLPTTPFLLLTAGLYLRSSERIYQWLLRNKYLGAYISEFKLKNGLTVNTKLYSLFLMWAMILTSSFFFIETLITRVVLVVIGLIGTLVMGIIIPTRK